MTDRHRQQIAWPGISVSILLKKNYFVDFFLKQIGFNENKRNCVENAAMAEGMCRQLLVFFLL